MQIKCENITINYTEQEKEYINEFLENVIKKSKAILEFFNLKKLEYPVTITFWDDLNNYRKKRNEQLKKYNRTVPLWEVGCAYSNEKKEHIIEILSLNERRKCEKHEFDRLNDIFLVGVHEYIHACHSEFKDYKETLTYINEGLATLLSNQFKENKNYQINFTKEELLMAKTNYYNYYLIMKYIIENKSKEYILELIKNKEMQEKELDIIYDEFKNKYKVKSK